MKCDGKRVRETWEAGGGNEGEGACSKFKEGEDIR